MNTSKRAAKTKASKKTAIQSTSTSASAPALCAECGQFIGRTYPHCPSCRAVVEEPIRAAWQALVQEHAIVPGTGEERALAASVLEQATEYWWSEVEAALRLTPCAICGGPLGYGTSDCSNCWTSSDMFWGRDYELGANGALTRNEHALRVILRGLCQERRHSQASLDGWRLYLPFLLRDIAHGPGFEQKDTAYAQSISAWIKAGRGQELFQCQSIAEMYALTRGGRR